MDTGVVFKDFCAVFSVSGTVLQPLREVTHLLVFPPVMDKIPSCLKIISVRSITPVDVTARKKLRLSNQRDY
ncbi:hypothetical protein ASE99_20335 [Serratia sp. Leaf51]|nr:hypothetical protein ASE99_20335 [Serratia sp. Leaf51]